MAEVNPRTANFITAVNKKGRTTKFNKTVWDRLKVGSDGSRNGWYAQGEEPKNPGTSVPPELKVFSPNAASKAEVDAKIEAAVKEATAQSAAQIEDLQKQLEIASSAATTATAQVDKLTNFLLDNEHLPQEGETAADVAIRLISTPAPAPAPVVEEPKSSETKTTKSK